MKIVTDVENSTKKYNIEKNYRISRYKTKIIKMERNIASQYY